MNPIRHITSAIKLLAAGAPLVSSEAEQFASMLEAEGVLTHAYIPYKGRKDPMEDPSGYDHEVEMLSTEIEVLGDDVVVHFDVGNRFGFNIKDGDVWANNIKRSIGKLTDPAILEKVAEVIGRYFSNPNNWEYSGD